MCAMWRMCSSWLIEAMSDIGAASCAECMPSPGSENPLPNERPAIGITTSSSIDTKARQASTRERARGMAHIVPSGIMGVLTQINRLSSCRLRDIPIIAIMTMKPQGSGTRYVFTALERSRLRNEPHVGPAGRHAIAVDQLVELVLSMR
jgi:hypothetical protein